MITAGLCGKDDVFKNGEIFDCFSEWCEGSSYPIVLMIDEVDTATNNQVFLDFLAQLRAAYLDGDVTPSFQSVILAGVYDIRNIQRKLRADEEHRTNSPWNIAARFRVDMSFYLPENRFRLFRKITISMLPLCSDLSGTRKERQ